MPFAAASVISPAPFELVRSAVAEHPDRMHVQRDPDLGGTGRAERPGGQAVAEQQVVGGGGRGGVIAQPGRVVAVPVAVGRDHLRLVEGDPPGDPVAERLGGQCGVVGEPFGCIPTRPASLILQFLREVPVVEGGRGRDAVPGELVEQRAVIVQPRWLTAPRPPGWTRGQEMEKR
jgi:hypothetical protein